MKQILFSFAAIIAFTGCEPGYRIYLRNNSSSDLFVKTNPSIESLYDSHSSYVDSIVTYKLKQESGYSFYKLKVHDTLMIWGNIGDKPTLGEMPFNYIAFINGVNTMILDSKAKIINQLKKLDKRRSFYIEIMK